MTRLRLALRHIRRNPYEAFIAGVWVYVTIWFLATTLATTLSLLTGCRSPEAKEPPVQTLIVEQRGCLDRPPPASPGGETILLPGEEDCPKDGAVAACVTAAFEIWVEELERYARSAWTRCSPENPVPQPAPATGGSA